MKTIRTAFEASFIALMPAWDNANQVNLVVEKIQVYDDKLTNEKFVVADAALTKVPE